VPARSARTAARSPSVRSTIEAPGRRVRPRLIAASNTRFFCLAYIETIGVSKNMRAPPASQPTKCGASRITGRPRCFS